MMEMESKEFDFTDEAAIALNVTRSIARNYEHNESDITHLAYVLFMMDESIGCRVVTEARQILKMDIDTDKIKSSIERRIFKRNGRPGAKRRSNSMEFCRTIMHRQARCKSDSPDISSSGTPLRRRHSLEYQRTGSEKWKRSKLSEAFQSSIEKLRPKQSAVTPLREMIANSVLQLFDSKTTMDLEMPLGFEDEENISMYHIFLILYDDKEICNLLTRKFGLSKGVATLALSKIYLGEKLDTYSVDLVKLVREEKIKSVAGWEKEVIEIRKILFSESRNNVFLIAEPNIATIDIVNELVLKIIEGDVPEGTDISVRILRQDELINGAKDFEEIQDRLQHIVNCVESLETDVIFIIKDFSFNSGFQSWEDNDNDIDSVCLLKSMLQNHYIKLIVSTHEEGDAKYIEGDSMLRRFFHKIVVNEMPSKQGILNDSMMVSEIDRVPILSEKKENIISLECQKDKKEDISPQLTSIVMDASFEPIILFDEKGLIEYANSSAVNLFGYSSQSEIEGKGIIETLTCDDISLEDNLRNGEGNNKVKIEVIGKRKQFELDVEDNTFPAMFSIVKSSSKYICFVKDLEKDEQHCKTNAMRLFRNAAKTVMKLNKENEEIKRSEQMTKGIIEAASDPLLVTDIQGNIQMVNEAAVEKLGYSREEFKEQNLRSIVGGDDIFDDYDIGKNIKRIGKCKESIATRNDGSEFPIELALQVVAKSCNNEEEGKFYVAFIRDITDQKKMIEMEIEKVATENLLLNMLPENVASRLKGDPSKCHIADSFSCTTILFADIVGFTEMSGRVSPKKLVKLLNDLFSRFDDLVDKYNLNKVKTIGDAYMVTSTPSYDHNPDDAPNVCAFALEMMDALKSFNSDTDNNLDLRVGINTGPVVAGIVGRKRFLYDLWGDAVNVASRMESTGIPGSIQVTKHVVEHADHAFEFKFRDTVKVKGKGSMDTYILQKAKPYNAASRTIQRRCSLSTMSSTMNHCNYKEDDSTNPSGRCCVTSNFLPSSDHYAGRDDYEKDGSDVDLDTDLTIERQ